MVYVVSNQNKQCQENICLSWCCEIVGDKRQAKHLIDDDTWEAATTKIEVFSDGVMQWVADVSLSSRTAASLAVTHCPLYSVF
jgi:hypothetical protein